MWYGRKPDVSHLRVFVCISYAHIPDAGWIGRSKKLRFVGYSKVSKGYRLFDEEGRKVVIRRDVLFDETNFGSKTETDQEPTKTKEVLEVDTDPVEMKWNHDAQNENDDHQSGSEQMNMLTQQLLLRMMFVM